MKSRMKALVLACCALLLVITTVFVTVAFLTSTDTVTNTFTVGKVAITLDEAKVTDAGVKDGDTRVRANTYKLMPGHSYIKDPIIHVASDSEDCWLFVKVDNQIANIEDTSNTIAAQMTTNGWTLVAGQTNVYAREEASEAGADVPVFASFKVTGDVDGTTLETYEGKTVVVKAYAVQADGFDTAAEAWAAAGFAG